MRVSDLKSDLKSELWLIAYDEEGRGWSYYWDAVKVKSTREGYQPLEVECTKLASPYSFTVHEI